MFATSARTLVAAAAAAVLSLGIASTVHADETPTDVPCAAQEAKVVKATAALARVTAVFETKKDKKAQLQRLAKAEARLAECKAAPPG